MRPAGLIDHDGTAVLTGDPAAAAVGLTLEPAGGSRPSPPPSSCLMALRRLTRRPRPCQVMSRTRLFDARCRTLYLIM
ncbi:anti-sigma factor [Streptomyces roseus]|uniref:anti-sigma factor n=1 Tax=Streptomyces roseus TaxID=66430 RepID=UPI001FD7B183|nr:anti-sigma factor [Streptomyces roseus]